MVVYKSIKIASYREDLVFPYLTIKNSTMIRRVIQNLLLVVLFGIGLQAYGQQDPQYTHYMYNTMSVNSGYAGSRGHFSTALLYRTQWVGLDGAPKTLSLGMDSPISKNIGVGLNIVHDVIGPSQETYFDGNFSYSIHLDDQNNKKLAFGLKAGGRMLSIDWSKGTVEDDNDVTFSQNVSKLFPQIGAAVYYHTKKFYLGASVPTFFLNDHYDTISLSVAQERLHVFVIGGYVFDLNETLKFKPAFLVKAVSGAPLIFDVSANFLLKEKLSLGVAYRWDDSVAGLIGFQITDRFNLGYSYDYTLTDLQQYNSGTHEFLLRYELISRDKKLISPRFF